MHFRVLGCGKILGTVYGQERLKHVFCIASIHIILIICGSKNVIEIIMTYLPLILHLDLH